MFILLNIAVLINYGLHAQTTFGKLENDLLPHSPESEAIMKNVALPVSLYTGMPQVSVPIYEIKGKSLSIPISLSYNYNGYKPGETANRAGLGWSVQGGGAITRMVKGRVDDEDANVLHQYDDYVDLNLLAPKQTVARDIAEGYIDAEPDLYVFNCNGLSGRFIWHQGHAFLFPHQNLRIQGIVDGFLITAENGDRYFFNAPEVTSQQHMVLGSLPVPEHQSAWFITKIISADLVDTVSYEYNPSNFFRQPPYIDIYTTVDAYGGTGITHHWEKSAGIGSGITTQLLTAIHYKNTSISFNDGDLRTDAYGTDGTLGSVTVTNNAIMPAFTKTFLLSHDYQNSKLNLRQVTVLDNFNDITQKLTYKFEYEDGLGTGVGPFGWIDLERNVDRWGYYNGASNYNSMMFTADDLDGVYTTPYQYGNRTPNFNACKTNALKKIFYPTGGQTQLEYEPNGPSAPGIRIKTIFSFDGNSTSVPSLVKRYTYGDNASFLTSGISFSQLKQHDGSCLDLSTLDKIVITYQAGPVSIVNDLLTTPFYYGHVTETSQSAATNGVTEYYFTSHGEQEPEVYQIGQVEKIYKNNILLPVKSLFHTDTLIQKFSFTGTTSTLTDVVGTGIQFCSLVPTPDQTQPVEGLEKVYHTEPYLLVSAYKRRMQTVETTWDGNGTNPLVATTNYFYDNPDYIYPNSTVTQNSKGQVLTTYVKYPLDYFPASVPRRVTLDMTYANSKVQTMMDYSSCFNSLVNALAPYQPYATHATSFINVVNSYHCEDNYLTASAAVISNNNIGWDQYYQGLNTARLNSTDPKLTSIYWMLQNNILTMPVETYSTIQSGGSEYLLAATRNEYTLVNTGTGAMAAKLGAVSQVEMTSGLLKSSFLSSPETYYRKQTELEYNAKINLISQWKVNDTKQSFIWSDNGQYILAASTNSAYSDLSYSSFEPEGAGTWSGVSSSAIQPSGGVTGNRYYQQNSFSLAKSGTTSSTTYTVTYWSKNGAYAVTGTQSGFPKTLRTLSVAGSTWTLYEHLVVGQTTITITGSGAIDELRLHPAKAQMTTYTYRPMVGLTSQADASNKIAYYDYDGFGRLLLVQDQDHNILKKYAYSYNGPNTNSYVGCGSGEAIWQNTISTWYCQVINGLNTGKMIGEQIDVNPCSPTFNTLRWDVVTVDHATCPPACEYTDCTAYGPAFRCVNGTCEQGIKIYTDTYTDERGYVCVYHYEWSDMWSGNYEEVSEEPCNND